MLSYTCPHCDVCVYWYAAASGLLLICMRICFIGMNKTCQPMHESYLHANMLHTCIHRSTHWYQRKEDVHIWNFYHYESTEMFSVTYYIHLPSTNEPHKCLNDKYSIASCLECGEWPYRSGARLPAHISHLPRIHPKKWFLYKFTIARVLCLDIRPWEWALSNLITWLLSHFTMHTME